MAKNLKTVDCMTCGNPVNVDKGTANVVCGSCTSKLAGAPVAPTSVKDPNAAPKLTKSGKPRARRGEGKKYVASGFPRGWHFKIIYKHTDGKTYSRGKEVTDAKAIAELETATV